MSEITQAYPERAFSGLGGISSFDHALSYFLLGCGTAQVATAAMLDHAIGPNVIADLRSGLAEFLDRNADRGWRSLADFRGLRRGSVVPHARIRRPEAVEYHGGYDDEADASVTPESPTSAEALAGRR
jgi:dihydropyrimidine dehydrogenase (NAD+) subunit PreA